MEILQLQWPRRCPLVNTPHLNSQLNAESQSCFTTGSLPPISSSWRQAPWYPRQFFIFQLNTCSYSPYVTSSLTRGWVCRLQLLLGLASAVILSSGPRGTHDHILPSQLRDFPNLYAQVPVLISPRRGWSGYTPRHCVPFHRLLRLAGLRCSYSTPPPHGINAIDNW
jgi:hypothetical protein